MSVMIQTTLGDMVVDLFVDECPITCRNFLKLCAIKYYHHCLFFNVQEDFICQTGDPSNTGQGGMSVYGLAYGEQAKYFEDEFPASLLKHDRRGLLSMASTGPNSNGSRFIIQLADRHFHYLDEKFPVFGEVAEGLDTLQKINEAICDPSGRPLQNIRIKHTIVLFDPFEDIPGLEVPSRSPSPPADLLKSDRLEDFDLQDLEEGKVDMQQLEEKIKEREAKNHAIVLEMIGDIPDADIKPPDNVLFVCKLNAVTSEEDLETIFSRFGPCTADIIKDRKTGDSLCYGFVEFDTPEQATNAYEKMDNTVIDDRRVHVDFSQSVAPLWGRYRTGRGGMALQDTDFLGGGGPRRSGGGRGRGGFGHRGDRESIKPTLQLKPGISGHGSRNDSKYSMVFGEEHHLKKQEPSSKRHRSPSAERSHGDRRHSHREKDSPPRHRRRDDHHHHDRHSRKSPSREHRRDRHHESRSHDRHSQRYRRSRSGERGDEKRKSHHSRH